MIIKDELDIDTKAIDPTQTQRSRMTTENRSPDKSHRKVAMRDPDIEELDKTGEFDRLRTTNIMYQQGHDDGPEFGKGDLLQSKEIIRDPVGYDSAATAALKLGEPESGSPADDKNDLPRPTFNDVKRSPQEGVDGVDSDDFDEPIMPKKSSKSKSTVKGEGRLEEEKKSARKRRDAKKSAMHL